MKIAAHLFRKYRKSINPPYNRKDAITILVTLFILIAIPLTVFSTLNVRSYKPKANTVTSYTIPILSLRYFPTKDGVHLDPDVADTDGMANRPIAEARLIVDNLRDVTISSLEAGSTYHGFKDPTATPSLNYTIYEEKEFLKEIPMSTTYAPFPDHFKLFSDPAIGVSNICDYIENKGVKEVWIWGYPSTTLAAIESNMAGPYGDISNSYRQPDLPVCSKTYTVYEYNYGRGPGMSVEDHGHQIEAIFRFVDYNLWNKWVTPYGEALPTVNHCGNVHSPPNTKAGYDWRNEADTTSNCEDWHPDGSGATKIVDCHTWDGSTCADDEGLKYKIWWMQNIPGKDNNLSYGGANLRNWWEFFGDFDVAMASGKQLYVDRTSSSDSTGGLPSTPGNNSPKNANPANPKYSTSQPATAATRSSAASAKRSGPNLLSKYKVILAVLAVTLLVLISSLGYFCYQRRKKRVEQIKA